MTQHEPLWKLPATELARRYRELSLTPLAVAYDVLARIDEVNGKLNAVVSRRDKAVLAEAQAAGERFARGTPLSMLDGIPLTVKDSLYLDGLPTTCGTPALKAHVPGFDELAAARAREAGALILGKTNVPEFANDGYTGNPVFGVTGNPWAPELTPGGSSGGAVAAVAAGMGPLAIAQDGGGSIRRPASHTGLVGLKPSLSAWPRVRQLPGLLLDFDCIGPVGRTVADVRMLFELLRGPDAADRSSLSAWAAQQRMRPATGPLRVLYVEHLNANPLDRQIAANCRTAVQRLAALGHHVEEGELPVDIGYLMQAWPEIGQVGLAAMFEEHPDWEAQASAKYREGAEAGRRVSGARVWQIMERVRQLRRDVVGMFEQFDVIAMPSAAALPWPAHEAFPPRIDGKEVGPRGHAAYTGWVNAAGLPGLSVPTDPSREGLPIGLQLIGPYGCDDLLLDLGAAYEAVAPWAHRWPAL
ncbi:MAG: amidase [Proteobacteria bacterium]|nr:amidase [Pseudomonadota bacterium]